MKSRSIALLVALAATGCSKAEPTAASAPPAAPSPPSSAQAETQLFAAPSTAHPQTPESLASHRHPELLEPDRWQEPAPAGYKAKFSTNKGDFVIQVHRDWAPNAADRFYNLVKAHFYDDVRFHRVKPGAFVQFGISGDPAVSDRWKEHGMPDEPRVQSNKRGFVAFAHLGRIPNMRTTQVVVHLADNSGVFDANGFVPFGEVVQGLEVLDGVYSGYGIVHSTAPDEREAFALGNAYLADKFPRLDWIQAAAIVP